MDGNNNGVCRCQCHEVSFPPGFRFNPSDAELIINYLKKKIMKEPFPFNEIMKYKFLNIDIYHELQNPEMLAERFKLAPGEKTWYIFTPRYRRDPKGTRPNRVAGTVGFWKTSVGDQLVVEDGAMKGYKKSLVFQRRTSSKAKKTNWLMQEYTIKGLANRKRSNIDDIKLDDWVLCKVYKKMGEAMPTEEEEKTVVTAEQQLQEEEETTVVTGQHQSEEEKEAVVVSTVQQQSQEGEDLQFNVDDYINYNNMEMERPQEDLQFNVDDYINYDNMEMERPQEDLQFNVDNYINYNNMEMEQPQEDLPLSVDAYYINYDNLEMEQPPIFIGLESQWASAGEQPSYNAPSNLEAGALYPDLVLDL